MIYVVTPLPAVSQSSKNLLSKPNAARTALIALFVFGVCMAVLFVCIVAYENIKSLDLDEVIEHGDLETVKAAVVAGAKISENNVEKAIDHGHEAIAIYLVQKIDVRNLPSYKMNNILREAIDQDMPELFVKALENGWKYFFLPPKVFEKKWLGVLKAFYQHSLYPAERLQYIVDDFENVLKNNWEQGANVIAPFVKPDLLGCNKSYLRCTVAKGWRETAEHLIGNGFNLNALGPTSSWSDTRSIWATPLTFALENGHIEVAQLLIEKGAHVTTQHWSTIRAYPDLVNSWMEAAPRDKLREELYNAFDHSDAKTVELIAKHRPEVFNQSDLNKAINKATKRASWNEAIKLIISADQNASWSSCLLEAVKCRDINETVIGCLIDKYKHTANAAEALGYVTTVPKAHIIRLMKEKGVDFTAKAILPKLCFWGYGGIASEVLDLEGVDPNEKGSFDFYPLYSSILYNHTNDSADLVQKLIAKGANIQGDYSYRLPDNKVIRGNLLFFALLKNKPESALVLAKAGLRLEGDPNCVELLKKAQKNGWSDLEGYCFSVQPSVTAQEYTEKGIKLAKLIKYLDDEDRLVRLVSQGMPSEAGDLAFAIHRDFPRVANALLDQGHPHQDSYNDRSALELACKKDDIDLAEKLCVDGKWTSEILTYFVDKKGIDWVKQHLKNQQVDPGMLLYAARNGYKDLILVIQDLVGTLDVDRYQTYVECVLKGYWDLLDHMPYDPLLLSQEKEGKTPLSFAIDQKQLDTSKGWIASGVTIERFAIQALVFGLSEQDVIEIINKETSKINPSACVAMIESNNEAIYKALFEKDEDFILDGAVARAAQTNGCYAQFYDCLPEEKKGTPTERLHRAIKNKDFDSCFDLIEQKQASVSVLIDGKTAMQVAVEKEAGDIVEILALHKAKVSKEALKLLYEAKKYDTAYRLIQGFFKDHSDEFIDASDLCILKEPKTLKCGHTVSNKSLSRLPGQRCPSCREKFRLEEEYKDFQAATFAQNFLAILPWPMLALKLGEILREEPAEAIKTQTVNSLIEKINQMQKQYDNVQWHLFDTFCKEFKQHMETSRYDDQITNLEEAIRLGPFRRLTVKATQEIRDEIDGLERNKRQFIENKKAERMDSYLKNHAQPEVIVLICKALKKQESEVREMTKGNCLSLLYKCKSEAQELKSKLDDLEEYNVLKSLQACPNQNQTLAAFLKTKQPSIIQQFLTAVDRTEQSLSDKPIQIQKNIKEAIEAGLALK